MSDIDPTLVKRLHTFEKTVGNILTDHLEELLHDHDNVQIKGLCRSGKFSVFMQQCMVDVIRRRVAKEDRFRLFLVRCGVVRQA